MSSALQTLRQHARRLMALCLLAYGLALAMPTLAPQSVQMVCAGAGIKLVASDGSGDGPTVKMDCPLCGPAVAPPSLQTLSHAPDALAHALAAIPQANLASLTAPPLPARGPPQA